MRGYTATVARHERLQDQRDPAETCPGRVPVGGAPQNSLPLAVVAETTGLEHGRVAQLGEAPLEAPAIIHREEGGDPHPEPLEEGLFGETVLRHGQRAGRREDWKRARQTASRLDRDVLELVGDGLEAGCEALEGRRVVVGADDQLARRSRGGVRRRVEEPEAEPEGHAGEGQHPTELAPADDAERHRRRGAARSGAGRRGSGAARTARVWASR